MPREILPATISTCVELSQHLTFVPLKKSNGKQKDAPDAYLGVGYFLQTQLRCALFLPSIHTPTTLSTI